MFEKLKLKLMKKLLLILGLIPFLNSAQIVNPCISSDTVLCGPHANDYTYNRTRGFWFQAKSTFNIVGLKAGDGNSQGVTATHQSIEIIKQINAHSFTILISKNLISIPISLREKNLNPDP